MRQLLAMDAWIANVDQDNWVNVRLFDISKSGVSFIHPQELALDKLYSFEFMLPDSDGKISCVVIVLHTSVLDPKKGHRVGARFVGIEEGDMDRVDDYVRAMTPATVKKLPELR